MFSFFESASWLFKPEKSSAPHYQRVNKFLLTPRLFWVRMINLCLICLTLASASSSSRCITWLLTYSLVYKPLIASVSRVGFATHVETTLPTLQVAPLGYKERPCVAVTAGLQEHCHSTAVLSNLYMSGMVDRGGLQRDSVGLVPGGLGFVPVFCVK